MEILIEVNKPRTRAERRESDRELVKLFDYLTMPVNAFLTTIQDPPLEDNLYSKWYKECYDSVQSRFHDYCNKALFFGID